MHTETITWHTPAERMPDIDTTVLLRMPENYSEPVWPGFFTGEVWCDESSMVVDQPLAWAEMPAGAPAGVVVDRHQTYVQKRPERPSELN